MVGVLCTRLRSEDDCVHSFHVRDCDDDIWYLLPIFLVLQRSETLDSIGGAEGFGAFGLIRIRER